MTWLDNFFAQSTNDDFAEQFSRKHREAVFLAMELGKLAYTDIMKMPVHRLDEYLEWKIKYDNERERAKADNLDSLK